MDSGTYVNQETDFFAEYLEYCSGTEVPPWFDRWSLIIGLGAWLGRRVWIPFGDNKIYPNIYGILVGAPGTKKSTPIKRMKSLLLEAGYDTFAAEKTSKEKFLLDLAGQVDEEGKDFLSSPFGEEEDKEVFIAADEFNDFFGNNILEFVAMLGVLWDYNGAYKNRIKNGTSIVISNPTVSILGGTTEISFANTFPPDVIGQGFFSRLIAVYAPPTGLKITWPARKSEEERQKIIASLHEIRSVASGEMIVSAEAKSLIDIIYRTWTPLKDHKFAYYSNRRLGHLLKLCMIHALGRKSMNIIAADVTYANTVLSHTEHFMPYAFAAFGQAKNSRLTFSVLQAIQQAIVPLDFNELWKQMQGEAAGTEDVAEVVRGLINAERIQLINQKFLPRRAMLDLSRADEKIDYRFLTDLEKSNV